MNKLRLLSLLLIAFGVQANAQLVLWPSYQDVCVTHDVPVSAITAQRVVRITSACRSVLPLERTTADKDGLAVDAWYGGAERDVVIETTYHIDHSDYCSGTFQWAEDKQSTTFETLMFNVPNLNLDRALHTSYASKARMTEAEARSLLPTARRNCRALRLGPIPLTAHLE